MQQKKAKEQIYDELTPRMSLSHVLLNVYCVTTEPKEIGGLPGIKQRHGAYSANTALVYRAQDQSARIQKKKFRAQ